MTRNKTPVLIQLSDAAGVRQKLPQGEHRKISSSSIANNTLGLVRFLCACSSPSLLEAKEEKRLPDN